ncbi:hypothetical protein DFH28DRAFT_954781 [Melampsora americana]|nr:hypothetical protein DFH28DRAFT_954781 [Melampsora americana]
MFAKKSYGFKTNVRSGLLLCLIIINTIVNGMVPSTVPVYRDIGSTQSFASYTTAAQIKHNPLDIAMKEQSKEAFRLSEQSKEYGKNLKHRKVLEEKQLMSAPPTQSFEDASAPAPESSSDSGSDCCLACLKTTGICCALSCSAACLMRGMWALFDYEKRQEAKRERVYESQLRAGFPDPASANPNQRVAPEPSIPLEQVMP